ncbi:hypothetical protein BD414DRAFT_11118 [Trametes punicea]|nr:hypothetical protein BD414DRAFT_11118 [Trametes punicea]
MCSNLEEGLASARLAAQAALRQRQKKLDQDETNIAESRVRYEAEQVLLFYDELNGDKVSERVAVTIMRFKEVERNIGQTMARTLRLTSLPLDDTTHISEYTRLLDTLGKHCMVLQLTELPVYRIADALDVECEELTVWVQSLLPHTSPEDRRLSPLLGNLLRILRGYAENVACAKDVVQCCKENYRMAIETLTLG